MNDTVHQLSFINHHSSIINYEKASRAKTDYSERRFIDCVQHSYFIAFQQ